MIKTPSEREDFERAFSCADEVVFMPGCSLRKIAPQLSIDAFELLEREGLCETQYKGCCGMPHALRGDQDSYHLVAGHMAALFKRRGIKSVITACPNCYYSLKATLPKGEDVVTVHALPEVLYALGYRIRAGEVVQAIPLTIHDSCPDRTEGIFAGALRRLMYDERYQEMAHNRRDSLCCGAGSVFIDLPFDEQLIQAGSRLQEAEDIFAPSLITACASCAFALSAADSQVEVYHYLEPLLARRVTWRR